MDRERDDVASTRRRRIGSLIPRFLSAIPVLMIPALEWIPSIPGSLRPWLILGSLAIAAVGLVWVSRREQHADELAKKIARLRRSIEKAEPEYLLQQVAATIFREGAWRLTVYRKAHSVESGIGDHLVKLASVASDGDQRSLGASAIPIHPSTLFQHLFLSNLADPRFRRAEQSGGFPDDVHSEAWVEWRNGIFGHPMVAFSDASTFRARKYVWYAAQEPRSQAVFATIAESADQEGIVVEYLDHVLTPAWLFFVSQLAELRGSADVD